MVVEDEALGEDATMQVVAETELAGLVGTTPWWAMRTDGASSQSKVSVRWQPWPS